MELSCPQCETRFTIANEALGTAGRKVRCSACSHVWHAAPAPEDDALTLQPAARPEPVVDTEPLHPQAYADSPPGGTGEPPPADAYRDLPPLPVQNFPRRTQPEPPPQPAPAAVPRARWGAVIFGLVLLAGIAVSYLLRDQIAAAVPAAKQVYQLAELPLQAVGDGLEFVNLSSGPVTENGQPLLRVTGFIQNTMDFRRALPWVRIEVLDGQNTVVATATRPPPQPDTIEPQGAIRIVYDLPQPDRPVEGMSIAMDFVEEPSK